MYYEVEKAHVSVRSKVSKWTKDFRKKGLEFVQFKELVTTASQHSVESNDEVREIHVK